MQCVRENCELPVFVLVVDEEEATRRLCSEAAGRLGCRALAVSNAAEALGVLDCGPVDVLITRVKTNGAAAAAPIEQFKSRSPQSELLLITAQDGAWAAAQALRLGASGYLASPFTAEQARLHLERIVQKVNLATENRVLRGQIPSGYGQLLGASPAMQKLFKTIVKVSQSHYPLLIVGESGTGKELVARSIHENGPLMDKPFVPIDCSALVPTLIESELFGYVRGAFTGAVTSREGLLQAAQGGIVFLDEIGELPLELQAKLLRALQEREVRPLGSTRCVKFEARVIAASNRDLQLAVEQGAFRKDLYFRLNVVTLKIPPLRERKSDILLLVNHFLQKFSAGQRPPELSQDALNCLMDYDWPGNVRELENCIERTIALASGPVMHVADLPTTLQNPGQPAAAEGARQTVPLHELERHAILRAVAEAGGDKLLAARRLGIGKTTLYRKLKEYGCT